MNGLKQEIMTGILFIIISTITMIIGRLSKGKKLPSHTEIINELILKFERSGFSGERKKELVMEAVKRMKIKMSDDDLSRYIDEVVDLTNNMKKIDVKEVVEIPKEKTVEIVTEKSREDLMREIDHLKLQKSELLEMVRKERERI